MKIHKTHFRNEIDFVFSGTRILFYSSYICTFQNRKTLYIEHISVTKSILYFSALEPFYIHLHIRKKIGQTCQTPETDKRTIASQHRKAKNDTKGDGKSVKGGQGKGTVSRQGGCGRGGCRANERPCIYAGTTWRVNGLLYYLCRALARWRHVSRTRSRIYGARSRACRERGARERGRGRVMAPFRMLGAGGGRDGLAPGVVGC